MAKAMYPTPMLDQLESGPWPSFVTGLKRLAQDKGFDQELAAFVAAAGAGTARPIPWRSLYLTTLTTLKIEAALRSGQPEQVR